MLSFGTILFYNWLIGILLVEYALHKTKAVRRVDEDRDSRFPAFRRTDTHLWNRPRLYLGAFFAPVRLIIPIYLSIQYFIILKYGYYMI